MKEDTLTLYVVGGSGRGSGVRVAEVGNNFYPINLMKPIDLITDEDLKAVLESVNNKKLAPQNELVPRLHKTAITFRLIDIPKSSKEGVQLILKYECQIPAKAAFVERTLVRGGAKAVRLGTAVVCSMSSKFHGEIQGTIIKHYSHTVGLSEFDKQALEGLQ